MPRVLLQLIVFLLVGAGVSVGFALLVSLAFPGRGFLPAVRTYYRIDFKQDAGGKWGVTHTVPMDNPQHTAPPSGVSIFVQESSMGRWNPGEFSAWRMHSWILEGCVGADGELFTLVATPRAEPNCPPDLLDAILAHMEGEVIPNSKVWELWPLADDQVASRAATGMQHSIWWIGRARGTSGAAVAVAIAVGLAAGMTAAFVLRRRPVPRVTPPN